MAKKSPRQRLSHRALGVLVAVVAVAFGASAINLGRIQLVQSERYRAKAEENQLQDTLLAAERGIIYDANGKILAQSASVWRVYLNPSKIPTDEVRETLCKRLSEMLDISYETMMNKAKLVNMSYLDVRRRIELDKKNEVSDFLKEKVVYHSKNGEEITTAYSSMVGIDPDVKRYYPLNSFACSILGFSDNDDNGRAGVELKYNDTLSGTPGRRITAENGRRDLMPLQFETLYEAQRGTSLVLTIDEVIQRYLEKALEQAQIDTLSKAAYGIVMDVETGAIVAMANTPTYNLNEPHTVQHESLLDEIEAEKDPEKKEEATNNAKFSMWRNRCISDIYDPGSVFKIVLAAAGVEEQDPNLNRTFHCTGALQIKDRTYRCHKRDGHGTETYTEGLMNSCNPFFITLGQSLGIETFYKYFEAFGFTEKTGIDLPAEAQPVGGLTYHKLENMTTVNLASSSFGQSFQASPIQIINMVACIGNGGKLMQPYVVAKQLDESGNTVRETQPTVKRQVVSAETAATVAEMMRQVVSDGTGKNAYIPGYNMAGKTGTSQKLGNLGTYVASFAGFAPADNPRLAILITIDEPGGTSTGGGAIAAPVAARVMEDALIYLNVEPKYTQEELDELSRQTPSLTGRSVEQAKNTLSNASLHPRVVGDGETVISQVPAQGQSISKGGVVILYTEENLSAQIVTVPDFSGYTISQANSLAVARGLNLRISGNALRSGELISYKQSIEADTQVEMGSSVTVYFKSDVDISDLGQ